MEVLSTSPQETAALAEKLARKLNPEDVVALYGELGSGKTIIGKVKECDPPPAV